MCSRLCFALFSICVDYSNTHTHQQPTTKHHNSEDFNIAYRGATHGALPLRAWDEADLPRVIREVGGSDGGVMMGGVCCVLCAVCCAGGVLCASCCV